MNINFEGVLKELFTASPDFEQIYDAACKVNQVRLSDGEFVVWGEGILPGVFLLLQDNTVLGDPAWNKEILTDVFAYFETMATSDPELREFFKYATMDRFLEDPDLMRAAQAYMGKETLRVYSEYETFDKEARLWQLSKLYSEDELAAMGEAK